MNPNFVDLSQDDSTSDSETTMAINTLSNWQRSTTCVMTQPLMQSSSSNDNNSNPMYVPKKQRVFPSSLGGNNLGSISGFPNTYHVPNQSLNAHVATTHSQASAFPAGLVVGYANHNNHNQIISVNTPTIISIPPAASRNPVQSVPPSHSILPPPPSYSSVPPPPSYGIIPPLSRGIMTLTLLSHTEFSAKIVAGKITAAMVADIQAVRGARFDREKGFVFPLEEHAALVGLFTVTHRLAVDALPRQALAAAMLMKSATLTGRENAGSDPLLPLLLPRLHSSLATFQLDAVRFAIDSTRLGRVLIADEMGLGKTRTAIAAAVCYKQDWPLLILCPSSAKYHWLQELCSLACPEHLTPNQISLVESASHPITMPHTVSDPSNSHSATSRYYKVLIVSYGLIGKMSDKLKTMRPNVIICDECHYLKSASAQRTKGVSGLVKGCRRAIFLSGTPVLSRPSELYTTLNMLRPAEWNSEADYINRYCRSRNAKKQFNSDSRGASHTAELHVILAGSLMIRRLKKDVLVLPKKKRTVVEVAGDGAGLQPLLHSIMFNEPLSGSSSGKSHSGLKRSRPDRYMDLSDFDDDYADASTQDKRINMVTSLYQQTGPSKVEAVLPHIQAFLDSPARGKLIVFAHHKMVLDRLESFLTGKGTAAMPTPVSIIRIDGETPPRSRASLVNQFQTDAHTRVAILSITAAGVALTLTAAHTVFFAELYWTPGALLQAEDRVHRIGQVHEVSITYFLARDSIDTLLWPLLRGKMRVLGEVVEGVQGSEISVDVPSEISVDVPADRQDTLTLPTDASQTATAPIPDIEIIEQLTIAAAKQIQHAAAGDDEEHDFVPYEDEPDVEEPDLLSQAYLELVARQEEHARLQRELFERQQKSRQSLLQAMGVKIRGGSASDDAIEL